MGNVVRLRNIHRTEWGPWVRLAKERAVFFGEVDQSLGQSPGQSHGQSRGHGMEEVEEEDEQSPVYSIEVPLDRVEVPGELWRTIVHFGMEQSAREQLGLPSSARERHRDLGALIMAIHDICDLWRIYTTGVDLDPWQGHVNQLTRWLMDEVDRLAFPADEADFITLGGRVFDMEERFNLRAIFAMSSSSPIPLHPLAAAR